MYWNTTFAQSSADQISLTRNDETRLPETRRRRRRQFARINLIPSMLYAYVYPALAAHVAMIIYNNA